MSENNGNGMQPVFPSPDPATLLEADRFERMIAARDNGQITDQEFRRYRLNNGTYGIRGQVDIHMIRVKLPFGALNVQQAQRLAQIAEDYAPKKVGHITTRQCVQYHLVPLQQVPEVIRLLGEVGLTNREACGNTVRNVTGCPLAGICREEVFDIRPWATACVRHFIRHPAYQNFPRKFKTAFSGCGRDCAMAGMHDIGAIAVEKEIDGRVMRGFRIYVGGGLGSIPRTADLLEEFTPADQFFITAEAIMRMFDRYGERKNMHRNRLKFLINDLGIERFREMVLQERRLLALTKAATLLGPVVADNPGEAPAEGPPAELPSADGHGSEYAAWLKNNVIAQKQPGLAAAQVTVPGGDLTPDQWRLLARLARRHGNGWMTTTVTQDIIIRSIKHEDLPAVYEELAEAGLGLAGRDMVFKVVGCPGADTCNLAITHSHRLAMELTKALAARPEYGMAEDLRGVTIKVSGCPNSCGQHHIANIGLYGNATKVGERQVPLYQMLLGGGIGEGFVKFGEPVARIPAKRVAEALFRLFDLYRAQRNEGETFTEWVARMSDQPAEAATTA